MEMMANVEVLGRETIKPSSPTPHHLRNFRMSFMDQRCPPMIYTSFVLFYAFDDTNSSSAEEKSRCLKNSLSQVLTHYYPLAGKIKDHMSVDCNDHGALFIDARVVGCSLTDLLRQPDVRMFRNLVEESPDHLLIIQATSFTSGGGGIAIGFSISHKVADGVSMCSFLKAWSNTAVSNTMAAAVEVDLTSVSTLFPPLDPLVLEEEIPFVFADGIPRRYVFSSSSIENLKTKAATNDVPKPTRVEVVSSLIWKCRMATGKLLSPTRKPSMLLFGKNLRPILQPPLPEHTLGNIIVEILTQGEGGRGGDTTTNNLLVPLPPDVSRLVRCIRSSLKDFRGEFVAKYQVASTRGIQAYVKELWSGVLASLDGFDLYVNVSWCRLPFYQADFGWGRPAWVSGVPCVCLPTHTRLIDTRDGNGIEAHVNFATEEEATLFESNQELLQHVELNPCVLL